MAAPERNRRSGIALQRSCEFDSADGLRLIVSSLGSPVIFGPSVHSNVLLATFAARYIATENCERIAGDVKFAAIDVVEAVAQACTICQVRLLSACIEGLIAGTQSQVVEF